MRPAKKSILLILSRSLRQLCPRCGKGGIFKRWSLPKEVCEACGFSICAREPDTWFVMYMSTAGITGIFVIFFFCVPHDSLTVRILIPALAAVTFLATHPLRKSLAFALDYWLHSENG